MGGSDDRCRTDSSCDAWPSERSGRTVVKEHAAKTAVRARWVALPFTCLRAFYCEILMASFAFRPTLDVEILATDCTWSAMRGLHGVRSDMRRSGLLIDPHHLRDEAAGIRRQRPESRRVVGRGGGRSGRGGGRCAPRARWPWRQSSTDLGGARSVCASFVCWRAACGPRPDSPAAPSSVSSAVAMAQTSSTRSLRLGSEIWVCFDPCQSADPFLVAKGFFRRKALSV